MHSFSKKFLYTSENVSGGHPDKLCDYISDSILDACLKVDPNSRVACETATKNNSIMVFGEITCEGELNTEAVVRKAVQEIGYDDISKGMDYKNCQIIINIDKQSQEIHQAVGERHLEDIGAGDQGIMFGYATDEHKSLMPMSYVIASNLLSKTNELRNNGTLKWARPDMKSQVTIEYEETEKGLKPLNIHTILMSIQHSPDINTEEIIKEIKEKVIPLVVPASLITDKTKYVINPSGSFIVGGPTGDAGLTGRKVIADTYGGWGSHGGGCFSGKDGSKVDRSGAYAARWIAKSLVAGGFAHRCIVQLSYGIGIPEPISIYVNSFGTSTHCGYDDDYLSEIVEKNFELRAGMLVQTLGLKKPIFRDTTLYGHFLKPEGENNLWERTKDLSGFKK